MKIDMDYVEKLVRGNQVTEMQLYLTPIAQQIDDWAEQNREAYASAASRLELLRRVKDWRKIDSVERWDVLWADIEKELGNK